MIQNWEAECTRRFRNIRAVAGSAVITLVPKRNLFEAPSAASSMNKSAPDDKYFFASANKFVKSL